MKRMTLIAAALCLIMITTVGAGVVAAKQEANPRQAGESAIYHYDVGATDTPGSGKLMINLDQHKFVFNGKGFEPGTRYWLRCEALGRTLGSVVANPAGNVNLEGTWPRSITALPAAPAFTISSSITEPLTASFTARYDHIYQMAATWEIDASSSTGPIYMYEVDCYYTDASGNPAHGVVHAWDPDLAIQLSNINPGTPVTATVTVTDASGNTATSPEQTLPWPITASFTATYDRYYSTCAIWTFDASSSTGPIYMYRVDCYYTDAAGNPAHDFAGAWDPDLAIQLCDINPGTPVTATLTVSDASGNTATSPEQTLPWS